MDGRPEEIAVELSSEQVVLMDRTNAIINAVHRGR